MSKKKKPAFVRFADMLPAKKKSHKKRNVGLGLGAVVLTGIVSLFIKPKDGQQ